MVRKRTNLVGAHSHLFRGSPTTVAASIQQHGLDCVQLTPSFPHLRFDEPGQVTADRCRRAAEPFLQAGIAVVGLSGGANLLDPEPDRRHPAIVRLHALIRHSRDFGTEHVIINLDTREVSDLPSPTPSQSASRWFEIRCIIAEALRVAADQGVLLLLKPDARQGAPWRVFLGHMLDEAAHLNLRFVMDPANYLASSLPENLAGDAADLCERLGSRAPLMHAKDLHFGTGGVTTPRAGRGSFDYATFFRLYRRYQPDAPVILEHLPPGDIDETRAYMDSCLRAAE